MSQFFQVLVIPALILTVIVGLVGIVMWRTGIARNFWKAALWDDVAPGSDFADGPHGLSVVTDEISPDELDRFRRAETVCFAVRETSHLDPRFFWVHDFDHGRLYAKALFIALGIAPTDLVEVFGFASGAEGSGVAFWDDLGAIPLKLGQTGRYNEEPFRRLATILGKDLDIRLAPNPLSGVKQAATHLFIAHQIKESVVA